MNTTQKLIQHVVGALANALENKSKITPDILNLEGMSGSKTRHFYNNLVNTEDARYLEIGTFMGSTVCAAMYENDATVVCVDNWSEFQGQLDVFLTNFNKFKGRNNAKFIEKDCFTLDLSTLPKFNIYMYDGNHSDWSHYQALKYFLPCLDDSFIFVVDDWNWKGVRESTYKAINDLKITVNYEKTIIIPDESYPDKSGWWNGIGIFVLTKA
jgi:hypothetical protein